MAPHLANGKDPNVYDYTSSKQVVSEITIRLHFDGSMSVSGNIQDKQHALAMLETGMQTLRDYHRRQEERLIVPAHDTALA